VIDLRRNSGGILGESIKMAGMFIDEGPIVQVKNYMNQRSVHRDPNPTSVYTGPLVVLVSKLSASASEIVAAALQDYERALIVGDETTHGKGTVQTVYSMKDLLPSKLVKDPGQLKFTISKFYRIEGGTTQLHGVHPDIVLPSVYDYMELGEASLDNSLKADRIASVDYMAEDRVNPFVARLRKQSEDRVDASRDFQYVQEDIAILQERRARKTVSLNLDERLADKKKMETLRDARNEERNARAVKDVEVFSLSLKAAEENEPLEPFDPAEKKNHVVVPVETKAEDDDSEPKDAKEKDFVPVIDVYLEEAVFILRDYIDVLHGGKTLAAGVSLELN
jgi:carboxyl-terminal processing protease